MASEIIAKINGVERKCDENIAAAKVRAQQIADSAETQAEKIISDAVDDAKRRAASAISDARSSADKIVKAAAEKNKISIEEMRKSASGNFAQAVNAVAKRLAELA